MTRLISESFEGVGYQNAGWTETVGAGCTVDEDSTDISTPDGGGSKTLKCVAASSGYQAYSSFNYGSELDKTFTRFFVDLADLSALANGDNKRIITVLDSGGGAAWWVVAAKDGSGNIVFRCYFFDSGADTIDSSIVVEDTLYRIEVKFDSNASPATGEFLLDGVSQGTWTESGTARTGCQYWEVGMSVAVQAENGTMYFDLFAIDDADWPGATALAMATYQHHRRRG